MVWHISIQPYDLMGRTILTYIPSPLSVYTSCSMEKSPTNVPHDNGVIKTLREDIVATVAWLLMMPGASEKELLIHVLADRTAHRDSSQRSTTCATQSNVTPYSARENDRSNPFLPIPTLRLPRYGQQTTPQPEDPSSRTPDPNTIPSQRRSQSSSHC